MAAAVAPLLAPRGVMLSLQNGLGNVETVESIAGAERTLGARVIFGATVPQRGTGPHHRLRRSDRDRRPARRPGPARDEAARRWAAIIDAAGVPALYTDRLPALLWAKVFYNAALNPLGALLRVHYGALAEREDSRAIMDAAVGEAFAVAAAEGVELPWGRADDYRASSTGVWCRPPSITARRCCRIWSAAGEPRSMRSTEPSGIAGGAAVSSRP